MARKSRAKPPSPFRCFNSSPEVIRLVVLMYVRFPLSLRNVEDLLFERGIEICHETVRFWWNRFGPLFAADIRRQRVSRMRGFSPLAVESRRDLRPVAGLGDVAFQHLAFVIPPPATGTSVRR
jgi:hypothetical protein